MAKYPCPLSQDLWKRIEIWVINKFYRVNSKVLSQNNKEGWLRWAWTIKFFLENDYEWIYVDEFTVSDRGYKPFSWSLKGKKILCSIMLENFKNDVYSCTFIKGRLFDSRDNRNRKLSIFLILSKKVFRWK